MEYSYNYTNAPKPEKKQMGAAAIIAICTVISIATGIFGGVIGFMLSKTTDVITGGGNAVIYRDVEVKDKDGNKIENELTVGQVADLARDSVVEITTEAVSTGSFMMQYVSEGAGSGVILTEDGYIVTNHHVIDGATTISVRTTDGTVYESKLIGTDARTDLAVIKIEATGLKSAVVGDFEKCKLGDGVVAIGNPLGQLGGTVTDGIISATDREITIDNNIMTLIQTNTAINPGNSGGGLFNMSGQLIGIVNAKSSGEDVEGLGFAIPINLAQTVIEDLIEHGYVTGRVDTGIQVLEINDFQSAMYYRVNAAGLYVYSVREGSAAQSAGLKSGDLIKKLSGKDIKSEDDFNKIVESLSVGDMLEFTVVRNNKEINISYALPEYKPN